jgi:hypothetical protein
MLYKILQAHNNSLPKDVFVVFANTGLEHEKTYDFINECQTRWNVEINWLEFCGNKEFKIVNYKTANRSGVPFDLIINERMYLPSPMTRFCTVELKIRTMDSFAISKGFFDGHTEVVGLRYDEPKRVSRIKPNRSCSIVECPIFKAKEDIFNVMDFWRKSEFRLEIDQYLGNCVGCFLKSGKKIERIAKDNPGLLEWWSAQEDKAMQWKLMGNCKSGRFREDRPSYHGLIKMAQQQKLFDFPDDDTLPCNCTD